MLCEACQDIFSSPRKLSCGTYYPWKQNPDSFQQALKARCHLCSLIQENRSYNGHRDDEFPKSIKYAFKALNPTWARSGNGPKWLVPQFKDDDEHVPVDKSRYVNQFQKDPTPNSLGNLLATDSETLVSEAANSWLVLEFYGPGAQIVLPLELATRNEAEEIAQRNIDEQASTGCQEGLQLGRAWLHNCIANHKSCGPRQPETWLPTRILDVGSVDDPTVRLVLSSSLDMDTQYAALSHRWGADKSFVLNSANITVFQQALPISEISATIRNSIVVTRAIGLRYLWADSMCIVQDDPSDWARESASMAKVYGLSTCTIAAANSGCGDTGFFATRNQYRVRPCLVPSPFKTGSKYSFYIRSQYLNRIHDREVKNSPWYNRGWVFQERVLSPRLLIFSGTQILWACEQQQAAETWPRGKTSENFIDRFESFEVEKDRFYKLLDSSSGVSIDHCTWWPFLQDYMTSAQLTFQSDRLVAIQGIATLIQNLTDTTYCGGFWLNDDLPCSLLWKAGPDVLLRPKEFRAPSWSWAAVDGTVELHPNRHQGHKGLIRIVEHIHLQVNPPQRGRNTQEALRIEGMPLPAVMTISSDGNRCERVVTVEYSRRIEVRTKNAFKIILSWLLNWIIPTCQSLWKYGLKYICIVVGALLFIALAPAAIALIIGLIPVAIGLIPVVAALFVVGVALWYGGKPCWYIGKLLWVCWIKIYPYCCPCMVCRAERKENLRNAEAQRRREEAVARTARIFEDLERGIPLANIQEAHGDEVVVEDGATVGLSCSLDIRLTGGQAVEVVCLPVVREAAETCGLLLRLVDGTVDHYERVGIFTAMDLQLGKLPHPPGDEILLLV
ncbi:hypothetical protein QQS21_001379 [Conoideocrella luteorostrata]|uniref:Heterokaryon incompatibility domain-containing protein n=1 Tax=Conoideocrella luteorostrata TaxID=1105319 RepID=A0AAJ0D0Q1_9HYPO|nr:hypothetical protein QQS21_001379 [Conoideocrella luteorostrata]